MRTCEHCGWEVTNDGWGWIDNFGGAVCFWQDGVEFGHGVQAEQLVER